MCEGEDAEGYESHQRRAGRGQRKGERMRESHQGLLLGPVGKLRLWTQVSSWGQFPQGYRERTSIALKVRG